MINEMIYIKEYSCKAHDEWNSFIEVALNSLFMFNREYMDYHSDRFNDKSLMFYKDDELIALLPLSVDAKRLYSHGGLTYGGFIVGERMKQHIMNDCFIMLLNYMKSNGYKYLLYKTIPHIYHSYPCESDLYSIFLIGGTIAKIEASTVIDVSAQLKMQKGRKSQIARAKREGVIIKECVSQADFYSFIELENEVLSERHGVCAVHTGEELYSLFCRFPNNIHLIAGCINDEMIAGTVLFEYDNAIHTQYMAANTRAREIGALDYCIASVIEKYVGKKRWLDFGISTENAGTVLNEGLISQKEGFGGRTNVYTTWQIKLN